MVLVLERFTMGKIGLVKLLLSIIKIVIANLFIIVIPERS